MPAELAQVGFGFIDAAASVAMPVLSLRLRDREVHRKDM